MAIESKNSDYKLTFDLNSDKARVELVKDVVAIANSGGGSIFYGANETSKPGIDKKTADALDSAKLSDLVEKFISPAPIELAHDISELPNGNFIVEIIIDAAEFPIAMSRVGMWKGSISGKDKPVFIIGDIWTRHSSKNQRIDYEDIRRWILRAKKEEREDFLERITTLVNLPEGANIQVISQSGDPIDSAQKLLANVAQRRERDTSHLLTANDLLWIFQQRESYETKESDLSILIGSSLRRGATLFWWLIQAEDKPQFVIEEVLAALSASDRDKSDAARNIIELAAIFADDIILGEIIDHLRKSRYKHFRDEAKNWNGREEALRKLGDRIVSATHDGRKLLDYSADELESIATELAISQFKKRTSSKSRKLATVTRVLWAMNSEYGDTLIDGI